MDKFFGVLFGSLIITIVLIFGGILGWLGIAALYGFVVSMYAAGYGLHMLGVLLLFSTIFVLAWKYGPE